MQEDPKLDFLMKLSKEYAEAVREERASWITVTLPDGRSWEEPPCDDDEDEMVVIAELYLKEAAQDFGLEADTFPQRVILGLDT